MHLEVPWGHMKNKVLDGIFLTELIVVTAYIIYDNIQAPPYNGWFWAIVGYLFVYAMIVITWLCYGIFALLDEDKIYEMKITHHVGIKNKEYFKGTVSNGKYEHEVYLPYSPELVSLAEDGSRINVMLDSFIDGIYIVVKHV